VTDEKAKTCFVLPIKYDKEYEEDERDEGYLSVPVLKKRKSGEGIELVTKREKVSELGRKSVKKEKEQVENMKIEEINMVTTKQEEEVLRLAEIENIRVSKRLNKG
jgi:hypothetical protein